MDKFIGVKTSEDISSDIENYIDTYGMASVLDVLYGIASCKAEHLRENWQDESAARDWDRVAKAIDRCSRSYSVAAIDHKK